MRSRTLLLLACVGLSGCAFTQSVKPLDVQVATPVAPAGPLKSALKADLDRAAAQGLRYRKIYTRLRDEQKGRDAVVFAATTALSATAIFRGGANSLRYAGFFAGLPVFYDKAIPLSSRIDGARSTFSNYNALITAGNAALINDIDGDEAKLSAYIPYLALNIAVAEQLAAAPPLPIDTSCDKKSVDKCTANLVAAQEQAKKDKADVTALMATLATAKAVLADGEAAHNALHHLSYDVEVAGLAIDTNGQKTTEYKSDNENLTKPFPATPPPAPPKNGVGIRSPEDNCPDTEKMSKQTICLQHSANLLADVLKPNYVDLEKQIQNTVPKATDSGSKPPS